MVNTAQANKKKIESERGKKKEIRDALLDQMEKKANAKKDDWRSKSTEGAGFKSAAERQREQEFLDRQAKAVITLRIGSSS